MSSLDFRTHIHLLTYSMDIEVKKNWATTDDLLGQLSQLSMGLAL